MTSLDYNKFRDAETERALSRYSNHPPVREIGNTTRERAEKILVAKLAHCLSDSAVQIDLNQAEDAVSRQVLPPLADPNHSNQSPGKRKVY
jgi:hypothetical protein